jgi:hypothetical protein
MLTEHFLNQRVEERADVDVYETRWLSKNPILNASML